MSELLDCTRIKEIDKGLDPFKNAVLTYISTDYVLLVIWNSKSNIISLLRPKKSKV